MASGSQGCRCVRRARGPVSPAEVCVRAVRAVPLGVAFLTLLLGRLSAQEALAFAVGARVLTRFRVSVLTAVTPPGACRAASAGRSDVSLGIAVLGVCPSPRPPAPRVSRLILCRALEGPPDPRPPGRPALSQPALRRASAEIRRGSLRRRSPLCLVLSCHLSLSEGVTDDALCFSLTSESAKPLPGSACRRR